MPGARLQLMAVPVALLVCAWLLVIPEAGKRTALAVLGVLGNAWALRSCARISSGSERAAACQALRIQPVDALETFLRHLLCTC